MIMIRMTDKMCSNDDDDDDDGDVDAILRIRCNANDVENVPIHPSGSPISDPPIFFYMYHVLTSIIVCYFL